MSADRRLAWFTTGKQLALWSALYVAMMTCLVISLIRLRDSAIRELDTPEAREQIDSQRSKLAAIDTDCEPVRRTIQEAFVAGYRTVLWVAAGLAVASSLSAGVLIDSGKRH